MTNHQAIARRAGVKELAFKAVRHMAGFYHGDPVSAKTYARTIALQYVLDHADRKTFIDQATHTLMHGPNAN